MKKFKAWRYKCDHCGKNGYSAGHMRNHEKHCTANPMRICLVHKHVTGEDDDGIVVRPVAPLIEVLRQNWNDSDHGLAKLRIASDDCPCCILAAIRQSGACKGEVDGEGYTYPPIGTEQFNFKAELQNVWDSRNADINQREYYL